MSDQAFSQNPSSPPYQTMLSHADKIKKLRALFLGHGIQGYLVPRADEYQGECVADYAERLLWLTGFSGSAGASIILAEKAAVLSDGRYTIQLAQQLDLSVFHAVDSTKISIGEWLENHRGQENIIGYDPFLYTPKQIRDIEKKTAPLGIILKPVEKNLVDIIWNGQPPAPQTSVMAFPEKVAGTIAKDKIRDVAATLKKHNFQGTILTMPDSIAWLLNIRARDTKYLPVALSYAYVSNAGKVTWFIKPGRVPDDVKCKLGSAVEYIEPRKMMDFIKNLQADLPVSIDFKRTPMAFRLILERAHIPFNNMKDPCIDKRTLKTSAEIRSIRETHIWDGLALSRFLHWLDQLSLDDKSKMTEMQVAEKLESFRADHPAYKGQSFPAIAGAGANGAVVHYRATPETDRPLGQDTLFLLDTGGQYLYGTTDITRTISIGTPTDQMKQNFTLVLKGHIAVASAKFPEGTTGAQIDTIARRPLWEEGIDYAHGTGHGVGCYLSVHEEASNISPRGHDPIRAGMLLSNEPGYYREGAYGIRTENLILTVETDRTSENGKKILAFDTVSFAPIDLNLVVGNMLTLQERTWLNQYHEKVFTILMDGIYDASQKYVGQDAGGVREDYNEQMTESFKAWLKHSTRPV